MSVKKIRNKDIFLNFPKMMKFFKYNFLAITPWYVLRVSFSNVLWNFCMFRKTLNDNQLLHISCHPWVKPHANHCLTVAFLVYLFVYRVRPCYIVTIEPVLPPKNAMSPMGFDPGTARIVSHRSTNSAKWDHH